MRIRVEDILEAAREKQGLERLEQIKFAIVEKNGKISIIPPRTAERPSPVIAKVERWPQPASRPLCSR